MLRHMEWKKINPEKDKTGTKEETERAFYGPSEGKMAFRIC